ncbi:MAG TPA: hypothetical protein VL588_13310 [Bdellovibrionota bacterium]|jgi:hypothetical protein|nr:hypothetical protein [Bdellovibrionota bacterium]
MSANYDKNQRFSFVYSNLYQIYRRGKEAARNAELQGIKDAAGESFHVLKTEAVENRALWRGHEPEIRNYRPVELAGKRIKRSVPELEARMHRRPAPTAPVAEDATLKSLKSNLDSLNDLHSRLRFMLAELEELTKE